MATATVQQNYSAAPSTMGMDRDKIFALFFAFLMVSSMIAWGVTVI